MHTLRILFALLFAVGFLAPASAQIRQPPPYRILVTNDDGVRAPGLAAIAQILQLIGTPIIVAPADNRTGAGHSIVTSEPVFRQDLTLPNGLRAIGLTATPASAANIAIRNIVTPRPDLVVSGINDGYNIGFSVAMAGTVGAARMAAMLGVPAIAASMPIGASAQELVYAAEEVFGVARRVKQYGLAPYTFLNVNVPPMPAGGYKGYMVTSMAMLRGGEESFAEAKHPSGRTIYWNVWKEGMSGAPEGTDVWAVANGYVSVTPMRVDETDPTQFDALRAIFK